MHTGLWTSSFYSLWLNLDFWHYAEIQFTFSINFSINVCKGSTIQYKFHEGRNLSCFLEGAWKTSGTWTDRMSEWSIRGSRRMKQWRSDDAAIWWPSQDYPISGPCFTGVAATGGIARGTGGFLKLSFMCPWVLTLHCSATWVSIVSVTHIEFQDC